MQNTIPPGRRPVVPGRGMPGILAVWLAFFAVFPRAEARLEVTNLAQLQSLTPEEIAAAPNVHVRARVTLNDPQWNLLYLTDEFRGATVFRSTAFTNQPTGSWVEVAGEVGSSRNGPNIYAADIRPLTAADAPFPELRPKAIPIGRLVLGHDEAEWIEIAGVVRTLRRESGRWVMQVGNPAASVTVQLMDPTEDSASPYPDWINARVRVVGVCTVDESGSAADRVKVYCVHRRDVRVETASPVSLFDEALLPLGALPGMADTFEGAHRIRIRGAVTYIDPERLLYLGDGQSGLVVHGENELPLAVGDVVEASGFLSLQNGESHLMESGVRRLGQGVAPTPIVVGAETRFGSGHLASLIRVQGRLVVRDQAAGHVLLTLARPDLDELFSVDLRCEDPTAIMDSWIPDSLMDVTGIWKGMAPERGLAGTLLCRSSADLRVLRPPHWWTPRRLRLLVVSVGGFTLGAVLWVISLRRENRAKAEQLRRQTVQELAVERRYRELFENATDTLLILGADGTVLDLNPAAEQVFGKLSSELMGRLLAEGLGAEGKLRLREILEASRSAALADRFELSLPPRADGRVITLEVSSCRRLVRPTGEQIQIIAHEITERKQAEAKLAELNHQLLDISRRAGRAEVATNVLHNVGNVLNSLNVTTTLIYEGMRESKISSLNKVVTLLEEHREDLSGFFTRNPKGAQLTQYLRQLSDHLQSEQETILADLKSLALNVEHIKGIVAEQQDHRGASGMLESIVLAELVEEALALGVTAAPGRMVPVVRELGPMPPMSLDKHKVLQILVNLLRNAQQSVERAGPANGRVTVRSEWNGAGSLRLQVGDTGLGIAPENLTRIFAHGFTTKPGGHGFGLHASALAARVMGGSLRAESGGPGCGALFTLELPVKITSTAR